MDNRLADLLAATGDFLAEALHDPTLPWPQASIAMDTLRYVYDRELELRGDGPRPYGGRVKFAQIARGAR